MPQYRFEEIAINSTEKKKPVESDKDTYLGLEHLDTGCLHVTRWGSEVAPIGDKLIMRKGDVLFGRRRAYQKKVAIAPFDGIFSAHGMVLRPNTEVITERFFPFFISSDYFLDAAIKISVGSLLPTINWRDLKELTFNIPPLDEQDALADELWAFEDTKEAYNRLMTATDALVKSQFIEMFGDLGSNEKGWGLTTLGECCEINPRKSNDARLDSEIDVSFVAMPSVTDDGKLDASIIRPYSEVKNGFTYFAENDVLFAKITPCMENGKGAIAKGLKNEIGFGSTEFHVIRSVASKSTPCWVYTITMMDEFRRNAEKVMTGTGGQRRVPASYLSEFVITLPPLELQERFAAFVKSTDKSKFATGRNSQKVKTASTAGSITI